MLTIMVCKLKKVKGQQLKVIRIIKQVPLYNSLSVLDFSLTAPLSISSSSLSTGNGGFFFEIEWAFDIFLELESAEFLEGNCRVVLELIDRCTEAL